MCYVCAWSFPMYSTYNKLVVKGKTSFNISTFIHSNDMMQTCYRINSRFRNLVPKKPTVLLLECFACTHESSEETFSCLMNCFVHIILHTYTSFRIFFRFNEIRPTHERAQMTVYHVIVTPPSWDNDVILI